MKKVLVTGGSGFIGKHFIYRIEKLFQVTNYDLLEGYDIRSILPFESFDYVVHFAAKRSVQEGELFPKEYIDTNCWGTLNLLVRNKNSRFINISSSSVNEVKSIYGATKQFAESIANMHENSLNIRLYNVFGEGQSLNSGAVLTSFIKAKQADVAPIVYGSGNQRRDFTYVEDVVESIAFSMVSTQTGLVHFGYSDSMSVMELLEMVYGNIPGYIQKPERSFEIKDSFSPTRMPKIIHGRSEGFKRTLKSYEHSLSRVH